MLGLSTRYEARLAEVADELLYPHGAAGKVNCGKIASAGSIGRFAHKEWNFQKALFKFSRRSSAGLYSRVSVPPLLQLLLLLQPLLILRAPVSLLMLMVMVVLLNLGNSKLTLLQLLDRHREILLWMSVMRVVYRLTVLLKLVWSVVLIVGIARIAVIATIVRA